MFSELMVQYVFRAHEIAARCMHADIRCAPVPEEAQREFVKQKFDSDVGFCYSFEQMLRETYSRLGVEDAENKAGLHRPIPYHGMGVVFYIPNTTGTPFVLRVMSGPEGGGALAVQYGHAQINCEVRADNSLSAPTTCSLRTLTPEQGALLTVLAAKLFRRRLTDDFISEVWDGRSNHEAVYRELHQWGREYGVGDLGCPFLYGSPLIGPEGTVKAIAVSGGGN